jgi:hypothetical protein
VRNSTESKQSVVNIQYSDTEQAPTIERGRAFADTSAKATPKHVNVASLNDTWIAAENTTSASDTGKLLIKDGDLYQHRYDSYERAAIQDLSHYSLGSLNQNVTYVAFKTDAAHAGYQLAHTAVASGDSTGMLSLIINANKIIRINQQIVTTYTKTVPSSLLTTYRKQPLIYLSEWIKKRLVKSPRRLR